MLHQIRVVNIRTYQPLPNEKLIKIDRSTILGNPFPMKNPSYRFEVCALYEKYFYENLHRFESTLDDILHLLQTHNIALGCWCAPKKCHGETIKTYLERKMHNV